ncbi:MAG: hypothetical protein CEN92_117 [Candidatus Berkelbacteria bacterium Licking1014_96]|uniref:Uncharacterized protein n=1 Tax=Candidatus Berkelbacteria bacterium Licking1014_96 TaxID=2017149 RepID=A0A554LH21_9BACT|nr:MAG: hypothetical protein CEN92_117 [Candidatus Berkelbacteria bacterium Licking1014_96]
MTWEQLERLISTPEMLALVKELGRLSRGDQALHLTEESRETGSHSSGEKVKETIILDLVSVGSNCSFRLLRQFKPGQKYPADLGLDAPRRFFGADKATDLLVATLEREAGGYQAVATRCQRAIGAITLSPQ